MQTTVPAQPTPSCTWLCVLDVDAQRRAVEAVTPPAPVVPPPAPARPRRQKPAADEMRDALRTLFVDKAGMSSPDAAVLVEVFCEHFGGSSLYVPKGLPDAASLLAERNRLIVAAVAAGESLRAVGKRFDKLSAAQVQRICRAARAAA
jgi:Mor family transcriptional regulator